MPHGRARHARVERHLRFARDILGEEAFEELPHLCRTVPRVKRREEGLCHRDAPAIVDRNLHFRLLLGSHCQHAILVRQLLGNHQSRRVALDKLLQLRHGNPRNRELHPRLNACFLPQAQEETPRVAQDLHKAQLRIVMRGMECREGA